MFPKIKGQFLRHIQFNLWGLLPCTEYIIHLAKSRHEHLFSPFLLSGIFIILLVLKNWFCLIVWNHHAHKRCMLSAVLINSISTPLNYRIIWLIRTETTYPPDSKLKKKAIFPSLRKIIDLILLSMLPSLTLSPRLENLKLFFTLPTFHLPHSHQLIMSFL